jgi:growth hormone-inducible transmembrane protein
LDFRRFSAPRFDVSRRSIIMFRPIISKVGTKPLQGFFRSSFRSKPLTSSLIFSPVAKRFATHHATTRIGYPSARQATNWPKVIGQIGIIGGTIVGINLFLNRDTREGGIPAVEQAYLNKTFQYIGVGLSLTAVAARGLHMAGWSSRLMAMNPWVVLGGGLVLSIGMCTSMDKTK